MSFFLKINNLQHIKTKKGCPIGQPLHYEADFDGEKVIALLI